MTTKPTSRVRRPAFYVTRRATLDYQQITGEAFETVRRTLTLHLLRYAERSTESTYLARVPGDTPLTLRVWTQPDGPLLAVTAVERLARPLMATARQVYNACPSPKPPEQER